MRVQIVLTCFTIVVSSIFLMNIENLAFAVEYTNAKCGVSLQYPEEWTMEESDFVYEDISKTLADFSPKDDSVIYGVSISIENSGLAKKSMGYISEFQRDYATFYPGSTIMESGITEINGFPTHKIVYIEGIGGETVLTYLIIAYDREYLLTFEAADKEEFAKYSSVVDEMAESIKIAQPTFEGINC